MAESGVAIDADGEDWELTESEKEQIIAGKRDRLYRSAARAAVVFFVVSAVLVAVFKANEDFFDANSRFGILMGSANADGTDSEAPKINVRVGFEDLQESKLVFPFAIPIDDDDIDIREEFTQDKLIITLEGASGIIEDGITLVSDSRIMDAVGVYRQNEDVVVEVYCRDIYSYTVENTGDALTVSFTPLRSGYSMVALVYVPYEDRTRFALSEWQDSLSSYADENGIRLFISSNMQESYTQQDIADFARRAGVDAAIGIEVGEDENAAQSTAAAICNSTYYIQDFNSAQLSVALAGAFVSETQLSFSGFEESDEHTPLVYEASYPAATLKISLSKKDADSVEAVYKLNERLVNVIENTLGSVLGGGIQ